MGPGLVGFSAQLTRKTCFTGPQFGWRLVDIAVLSLLIQVDDALMSPLTVAFAVLIVASAFWASAQQILQTTGLSMAGYIILALVYSRFHPKPDFAYRHFHYLVGLAARAHAYSPGESHTCLDRIYRSRDRA